MALFRQLIRNTPESIMSGCVTTELEDQVKLKFRAFEDVIVFYMVIKLDVGTADEHLDGVAQLIVLLKQKACIFAKTSALS